LTQFFKLLTGMATVHEHHSSGPASEVKAARQEKEGSNIAGGMLIASKEMAAGENVVKRQERRRSQLTRRKSSIFQQPTERGQAIVQNSSVVRGAKAEASLKTSAAMAIKEASGQGVSAPLTENKSAMNHMNDGLGYDPHSIRAASRRTLEYSRYIQKVNERKQLEKDHRARVERRYEVELANGGSGGAYEDLGAELTASEYLMPSVEAQLGLSNPSAGCGTSPRAIGHRERSYRSDIRAVVRSATSPRLSARRSERLLHVEIGVNHKAREDKQPDQDHCPRAQENASHDLRTDARTTLPLGTQLRTSCTVVIPDTECTVVIPDTGFTESSPVNTPPRTSRRERILERGFHLPDKNFLDSADEKMAFLQKLSVKFVASLPWEVSEFVFAGRNYFSVDAPIDK
jgi:hypothetical protein